MRRIMDLHAPPDVRNRILDAAERIVQQKGVAGLTLEAAARSAGVSKGGLLYHFASKEALLAAMLERLAAFIRSEFTKNRGRQPEGPGRAARAMLAWAFGESDCSPGDEQHDRAAAVFLASFHHDPALLDPMRAVYAETKEALLADGLPPGHALTIMVATDGLFMAHLFGLHRPSEAEARQIRAVLDALLEPAP